MIVFVSGLRDSFVRTWCKSDFRELRIKLQRLPILQSTTSHFLSEDLRKVCLKGRVYQCLWKELTKEIHCCKSWKETFSISLNSWDVIFQFFSVVPDLWFSFVFGNSNRRYTSFKENVKIRCLCTELPKQWCETSF